MGSDFSLCVLNFHGTAIRIKLHTTLQDRLDAQVFLKTANAVARHMVVVGGRDFRLVRRHSCVRRSAERYEVKEE